MFESRTNPGSQSSQFGVSLDVQWILADTLLVQMPTDEDLMAEGNTGSKKRFLTMAKFLV